MLHNREGAVPPIEELMRQENLKNFPKKEIENKIRTREFLRGQLEEQFKGKLDNVTVGDVKFKPWEINALHEVPNLTPYTREEIHDIKERTILTEEATQASKEILKIYFKMGEKNCLNFINKENFAGHCKRAAAITQELLAKVNVKTIQVCGDYHAQRTERHLTNPSSLEPDGDYGHYWLYESTTGVIPISTEHARDDLVIVDPTRCQFDKNKPVLSHIGEDKYEVNTISKSLRSEFFKNNAWLWNEEELKQWRNILNDTIK